MSPFHGVDEEARELIRQLYWEKDEAWVNYSKETKKTDRLAVCLEVAQAGQSATEYERLIIHAQLAAADARVAGEFSLSTENPFSGTTLISDRFPSVSFVSALESQV